MHRSLFPSLSLLFFFFFFEGAGCELCLFKIKEAKDSRKGAGNSISWWELEVEKGNWEGAGDGGTLKADRLPRWAVGVGL